MMAPRFTSPPDRMDFNQLVWEIVRQVPPGQVTTYGQVAALIPPPSGMGDRDFAAWGARWVGGAMAACPENVPWQRVINSKGEISLRPGSGGADQRALLEAEGVIFDDRGRVNLKKYAWQGPDEDWRRAHGLVSQLD